MGNRSGDRHRLEIGWHREVWASSAPPIRQFGECRGWLPNAP
jgi:hypothetical protein